MNTPPIADAFFAGWKAAFVAAVEECEAYAKALSMDGETPEEVERDLARETAAKQIAVRLAQRAIRHAARRDEAPSEVAPRVPDALACDCGQVIGRPCAEPPTLVCVCPRCAREPDDAFRASVAHVGVVEERHWRVRERAAKWVSA